MESSYLSISSASQVLTSPSVDLSALRLSLEFIMLKAIGVIIKPPITLITPAYG